jgi:hypothetical protein
MYITWVDKISRPRFSYLAYLYDLLSKVVTLILSTILYLLIIRSDSGPVGGERFYEINEFSLVNDYTCII